MKRLAAIILVLSVTGCIHRPCRKGTTEQGPPPNVEQVVATEIARSALVAWLECDECSDTEVERLRPYAQPLTPLLTLALEGPSRANEQFLRRSLGVRWDEMLAFVVANPENVPGTREQFVNDNLSNVRALYQIRAARALVILAPSAARDALPSAIRRAERADVRGRLQTFLNEVRK